MTEEVFDPLDREIFEAARMLIARLRSEAAREDFDFASLGITWQESGGPYVAITDVGVKITGTDVLTAALVLLWSLCVARAEDENVSVGDVIATLGLRLALFEPHGP